MLVASVALPMEDTKSFSVHGCIGDQAAHRADIVARILRSLPLSAEVLNESRLEEVHSSPLDESGCFEFSNVPRGVWHVVLTEPGAPSSWATIGVVSRTNLGSYESDSAVLEFVLMGHPRVGATVPVVRPLTAHRWLPSDGVQPSRALIPAESGAVPMYVVSGEGQGSSDGRPASKVSVHLVDNGGAPITGGRVFDTASGFLLGVSDETGIVSVGSPALERSIRVVAEDSVHQVFSPHEIDEARSLKVPGARILSGKALNAAGEGIENGIVWVDADPGAWVETSASGTFSLPLPSGSGVRGTTLMVAAAEFTPASRPLSAGCCSRQLEIVMERPAQIEGVVLSGTGRAVPGALVALVSVRNYEPDEELTRSLGDEEGRFRLAVAGTESALDMVVSAPGFSRHRQRVPAGLAGTRTRVEVILQPSVDIRAWVTDEIGEPVRGAWVSAVPQANVQSAFAYRKAVGDSGAQGSVAATTGTDGEVILRGLTPGTFEVSVDAEGFAPTDVSGVVVPAAQPKENQGSSMDLGTIMMFRGLALGGQVLDQRGDPVALLDIEVALEQGVVSVTTEQLTRVDFRARTDDLGQFRIEGLPPGYKVSIQASGNGYVTRVRRGVTESDRDLVLHVDEAYSALVQVIEASTGLPVPAANIVARPESESIAGPARERFGASDSSGLFELQGLPAGVLTLEVEGPGFLFHQSRFELPRSGEILIELEEASEIRGLVLSEEDGPIAEAVVEFLVAAPSGLRAASYRKVATTDRSGNFFGEGPTGDQPVQFRVRHAQYLDETFEIPTTDDFLRFSLQAGGEIRGTTRDELGAPISGALVTANVGSRIISTVTTDAEGVFVLRSLGVNSYRLAAEHPDDAPQRYPDDVVLADTDAAPQVDIVMGGGGGIVGRVSGLTEDRFPYLTVQGFHSESRTEVQAIVDYQGEFRMERLALGQWNLALRSEDQLARETVAVVQGSEASVELVFEAGFRVSGTVYQGGVPKANVEVYVSGASRAVRFSGTDGRFSFEGLRAGEHTLGARVRGVGVYQRFFELDEDSDFDVELELGEIVGRVTSGASGQAVEEARVRLADGGPLVAPQLASRDGSFRLANVPAGEVRLAIEAEGYRTGVRSFELKPGETHEVEVELEREGSTRLRIRTPTGAAPGPVDLAFLDASGNLLGVTRKSPDANGEVVLEEAPETAAEVGTSAAGLPTAWTTMASDRLQVLLPEPAAIRGFVRDPTERAVPTIVKVLDQNGVAYRRVAFGSVLDGWGVIGGAFFIESLPPGTWTVVVAIGDEERTKEIAVSAGTIVQLEF